MLQLQPCLPLATQPALAPRLQAHHGVMILQLHTLVQCGEDARTKEDLPRGKGGNGGDTHTFMHGTQHASCGVCLLPFIYILTPF